MDELSLTERVEKVLDEDINPALAAHQGMVELAAIEEEGGETRVVVNFMGMCNACPSAIGGTLISIQNYLREELDMPALQVINAAFA